MASEDAKATAVQLVAQWMASLPVVGPTALEPEHAVRLSNMIAHAIDEVEKANLDAVMLAEYALHDIHHELREYDSTRGRPFDTVPPSRRLARIKWAVEEAYRGLGIMGQCTAPKTVGYPEKTADNARVIGTGWTLWWKLDSDGPYWKRGQVFDLDWRTWSQIHEDLRPSLDYAYTTQEGAEKAEAY